MWAKGGGKGKGGYAYGGQSFGGGGFGPAGLKGALKGKLFGGGKGPYGGGASEAEDKPKKRSINQPASWQQKSVAFVGRYIDGFKDACAEAFTEAGVQDIESDCQALIEKIEDKLGKTTKKYYTDDRTNTKMTAAQCACYVEEFVEQLMGVIAQFLYDKPWFEKVGWDGPMLMAVFHVLGYQHPEKVFSRTLKTEIHHAVHNGILAWSEEERITKAFWDALGCSGMTENQKKKANGHLSKSYDDAHFQAPYGSTANDDPGVAALQDFLKGWMSGFAGKAYSALENGLSDSSSQGIVTALTAIFTHLLDPNIAALPLSLQNSLPGANWAYIEECANEVVAEMGVK